MTVDQVIEKITINQDWAVEAYKNIFTAPPKERATFGLAAKDRPILAAGLQDLVANEPSRLTLVYYMLEDPVTINAEIAGTIDLTENIKFFIDTKQWPDELPQEEKQLMQEILAAAKASYSGTPWPEGLTDKVIQHGDHEELGRLLNRAPLTYSQLSNILSRVRSENISWLITSVYTNEAMPWSDVEKALSQTPVDRNIARAAASREELTDAALIQLMSLNDQDVFVSLYQKQRTRLKDEHYQTMLDACPLLYLECLLARSDKTPHWVLLALAKSPVLETQMELARRADLPPGLIAQMRAISPHLATVNVEQKIQTGQELSKDEIKTGLTSPYKSVRVSTITKDVGKKR